jgi:hypothetical protein
MPIFRLLSLTILIAVTSTLAAQSSPEKNPAGAPSAKAGPSNSSASTDKHSPNPETGLNLLTALDRIRIGEYSPQLSQFGTPRIVRIDPDWQAQNDNLCYTMRSYKVARDEPQSDSTHAAGYSTCQPAARFHTHSIEREIPPQN